jgi:hypothetical protein
MNIAGQQDVKPRPRSGLRDQVGSTGRTEFNIPHSDQLKFLAIPAKDDLVK